MLPIYFCHGMTLSEIGAAFKVTESRISQILTQEAKALASALR